MAPTLRRRFRVECPTDFWTPKFIFYFFIIILRVAQWVVKGEVCRESEEKFDSVSIDRPLRLFFSFLLLPSFFLPNLFFFFSFLHILLLLFLNIPTWPFFFFLQLNEKQHNIHKLPTRLRRSIFQCVCSYIFLYGALPGDQQCYMVCVCVCDTSIRHQTEGGGAV
jgi:hypothetical protein